MGCENLIVKIINHNDRCLIFYEEEKTPAEVEYLETENHPLGPFGRNLPCFRYRLKGGFEADPIDVLVVNPRPGRDDDGWIMEWDKVLWADDLTEVDTDGWVEDCFYDLLRADLWEFDWV